MNKYDYSKLIPKVCHSIRDCIDRVIELAPDNAVFVESGVYLGNTTKYIVRKLLENKKVFQYYCIDNFLLENVTKHHENNLDYFKNNLEECLDYIQIINSDSIEAIKNFSDDSVFFCFLDDCHEYQHLLKQIPLWIPKLKSFSILVGDDYYSYGVKKAVLHYFDKKDIIILGENGEGFLVENPKRKIK